jgi:hypothetical protein
LILSGLGQGGASEWRVHSTLIFENLKLIEVSKTSFDFSSTHELKLVSKFETNPITRKIIRAILRFRFSFPPPTMYENNFQILFLYIVGGGKEKRNLRIALINFLVMQFI